MSTFSILIVSLLAFVLLMLFMVLKYENKKELQQKRHLEAMDKFRLQQAHNVIFSIANCKNLVDLEKAEWHLKMFEMQYGNSDQGRLEISDLKSWLNDKQSALLKQELPDMYWDNDNCK